MKKRTYIFILLVFAILAIVYADDSNVKLNINSDEVIIQNSDEENDKIKIVDEDSYIKVENLPEFMKFESSYDEENKVLTLKNKDYNIQFNTENGVSIRIDADVKLNQGYQMIDSKIYIPIRALANAMSYGVTWDGYNSTIYLLPNNQKKELSRYAEYNFTDEDILWLSRINYVEARDGSIMKKIAVANVVLNRVRSDRFPNTIKEVLMQSGQFPPAHKSGFSTFTPPEESFEASRRAINGENNVDECLFFNMVPFPSKSQDEFFGNIEGDYFYY